MTDDLPGLGTALRDRVADEHPDLDRLVRVSTRAGTRLRRRRTAALGVGVAAAAVTVAGVVAAFSGPGGSGGGTGTTPGVASEPTMAPSPSESMVSREDQLEALSADASRQAELLRGRRSPVEVTAPGWRCDEPADEKFGCSRGDGLVTVTWRPAAMRVDYLDPAKADVLADVHTFVSEPHGRFFVTVAPAPGTTQAQVDEVGRSLVWVG